MRGQNQKRQQHIIAMSNIEMTVAQETAQHVQMDIKQVYNIIQFHISVSTIKLVPYPKVGQNSIECCCRLCFTILLSFYFVAILYFIALFILYRALHIFYVGISYSPYSSLFIVQANIHSNIIIIINLKSRDFISSFYLPFLSLIVPYYFCQCVSFIRLCFLIQSYQYQLNFRSTKMESRSYMFATAKKRSTLLSSKGIEFPREDPSAPRMLIVKKECPAEFDKYSECLVQNAANPDACKNLKEQLFICGKPGFKKANTDPTYLY